MVKSFEAIFGKFNIFRICTSVNYAQKWTAILCNYSYYLRVHVSYTMKHVKKSRCHIFFQELLFGPIATKEAYLLDYPAMEV
jgi:hypothetical protein